ncbi:Transmembrane protein [Trichinella pseudospiralis]|uniref:Transmembrane protein n=2 Tax=Trichinella pseudospiralis TaxID=6337 RepID=A0A0V1JQ10_TRIPS|nr:Transmembrane protein [Trichinella pseudospiralis]KRY85041.1 Transmembrane protein [Trichinella pseudospiralis]KRZ33344.1 Transmembrane protein [Trichinella pseudospiralis]KRZ37070.1 Transmembrane protein [Trichinella pseudospiralis]
MVTSSFSTFKTFFEPSSWSRRMAKCCAISAVAIGSFPFFKDVAFSQHVAKFYSKKDGKNTVKIPDQIQDLIVEEIEQLMNMRKPDSEELMSKFKLPNVDPYTNLKFFRVEGDTFKRLGSPRFFWLGRIGVPDVICFENLNEITDAWLSTWLQKSGIPKTMDSIDKDVLQRLKDTFILSEEAKRFAIQQQLHTIWTLNWPLSFFTLTALAGLLISVLYEFFVKYFYRKKVIFITRIFIIFYITSSLLSLYLFTLGKLKQFISHQGVVGALSIGDDYQKGAVEFFEKCLHRNLILRDLLGNHSEQMFTSKGNKLPRWYELPDLKLSEMLQMAVAYVPNEADKATWTIMF